MYIVAIAWVYVTLLVSITQPTVFRGIVTFAGVGLLPLLLLLYLLGAPQRRRNRDRGVDAAPATPAAMTDADGSGPPADDRKDASVSEAHRAR
jgi:hypothetical protein